MSLARFLCAMVLIGLRNGESNPGHD
ncbi:hypothetical protein AYI68_g7262, partial [Smittium mucronatum]